LPILAQILGRRFAALRLQVDVVRVPVVAERPRVLNRQQGQLLVVVARRVAPVADQLGHQVVSRLDRCGRVVDELGLHRAPTGDVAFPVLRLDVPQLQFLVALLAVHKLPLGAHAAVLLVDRPVVLRPEAPPQRPTAGCPPETDRDGDEQDDQQDQQRYLRGCHGVPPSPALFPITAGGNGYAGRVLTSSAIGTSFECRAGLTYLLVLGQPNGRRRFPCPSAQRRPSGEPAGAARRPKRSSRSPSPSWPRAAPPA